MNITTKLFGEISINEERIIRFVKGIIGFPQLQDFLLIHDSEKQGSISWLQSVQEPAFAIPVMNPLDVVPDYNPEIEDELLKPIETQNPDDMLVLVTITVPKQVENMTINLRAPIVIGGESKKACQIITEGEQYSVKYPIYQLLKLNKERAGE